jgi:acetyl esterase/lipase
MNNPAAGQALQLPADLDMRPMARPELAGPRPVSVFDGVVSHFELTYATPPGFRPLVLDLHVPKSHGGAAVPVVIYAHGGGFFGGIRAMGPWAFLLAAGYAVASVDYRLSGECRFPGPVHDVAAAVRWVRAHAGEYGLDPGAVIGFGSSAGAYLVSAVALAGDDHQELTGGLGPVPQVSCRLAAVIDHYAPVDFLRFDDDAGPDIVEPANAPGTSAARFLGFVPSQRPDDAERASLCRYVTPASVPFLIAHGDDDHRVGIAQSRRLHAALLGAGVRAELVVIPGADHGTAEFDQQPLHERTLDFLASLAVGGHAGS